MLGWYSGQLNQTEKCIEIYRRLCGIEPENYFALGKYLANLGREDEAADAYQQGWDRSADRVRASIHSKWLVDYYYRKKEKEKALTIAKRASESYSYLGLFTMADLLEKMEDLEGAEKYYVRIRERYDDPGVLVAFYRRHGKQAGYNHRREGLMKELFPNAMNKVSIEDFKGQPSSGVRFRNRNQTMRQHGLKAGDVIVAMDGYRVENYGQYRAIIKMKDDPDFSVIVWRTSRYFEVKANLPDRLFNWQVETYSGA